MHDNERVTDMSTSNVPSQGITAPVMIVAGGAVSLDAQGLDRARVLLKNGLSDFHGTVISGGTAVGIPGCVGAIAAELGEQKKFKLAGYAPRSRPSDAPRDFRYDQFIEVGQDKFSAAQVLRYWADILAAGIEPRSVHLVGIGGGHVSAIEYRIALALGAAVGLVQGTGGSADELLDDAQWSGLSNIHPLPGDARKIQEFVMTEVPQDPCVAGT